jgi:hypothetical protein
MKTPTAFPSTFRTLALAAALTALLSGAVGAETLGDIESNATTSTGSGTGSPSPGRSSTDQDTGASVVGQIFGGLLRFLVFGDEVRPGESRPRFPGLVGYTIQRAATHDDNGIPCDGRRLGDPDLPVVRLDLAGGLYSPDIRGWAGRLELGWGPVALLADRIDLSEADSSRASLSRISVGPMLRISPAQSFELDLGAGLGWLTGRSFHAGAAFPCALAISPWPWLSARWAPSWSFFGGDVLSDQDLSLWWTHRWISAFAGWRWIGSGNASTNGPQAGISLSY